MTPEERAAWAETQREHIRACGGNPRPAPEDPSPLVKPEVYAMWCGLKETPEPKEPTRAQLERALNRLWEETKASR